MSRAWRSSTELDGEVDVSFEIPRLDDDWSGFDALTHLNAQIDGQFFLDDIGLDMSDADWISTCMAAPFAVLLDQWSNYNAVHLTAKPPTKVYNTLRRCGFLPLFGHSPLPDGYRTSIPLTRIARDQSHQGAVFLRDQLAGRALFPPGVSIAHKKTLLEAFGEVFVNVEMHASTTNLYACGQYFHKNGWLTMAVVDGGRTIPHNVADFLQSPVSHAEALEWAFGEGNTTSVNQYGGHGLWDLRNFVRENEGKLTVVSGFGYWHQDGGKPTTDSFDHAFPGTAVLWRINLNDRKTYPAS